MTATTLCPIKVRELKSIVKQAPILVPSRDLLVVNDGTRLLPLSTNQVKSGDVPFFEQGQLRQFQGKSIDLPKLCGGMVVDGSQVYYVSEQFLIRLSLQSSGFLAKPEKKRAWQKYPAKGNLLPPLETSDDVYLVDEKGTAYQLEKISGKKPPTGWGPKEFGSLGSVKSSPVLIDELLYYIRGTDLYALSLSTGAEALTPRPITLGDKSWKPAVSSSLLPRACGSFRMVPLSVPADPSDLFKMLAYLKSQVPPAPLGAGAYGAGASATLTNIFVVDSKGGLDPILPETDKGQRTGDVFYTPTEIVDSVAAWTTPTTPTTPTMPTTPTTPEPVAFVGIRNTWTYFAGIPATPKSEWVIGFLKDQANGSDRILKSTVVPLSTAPSPLPWIEQTTDVFIERDGREPDSYWVAMGSTLLNLELKDGDAGPTTSAVKSYQLDLHVTSMTVPGSKDLPGVVVTGTGTNSTAVAGADQASTSWLALYDKKE